MGMLVIYNMHFHLPFAISSAVCFHIYLDFTLLYVSTTRYPHTYEAERQFVFAWESREAKSCMFMFSRFLPPLR